MARPRLKTPRFKLRLRGRRFYATWWWDGAEHRKSLETSDEQIAAERLAAMQPDGLNPKQAWAAWETRNRPSHKGGIAEAKAMVRLLQLGADVFTPWGHDHRSDFIIGHGAKLKRVQVKAAQPRSSYIRIPATSVRYRRGKIATTVLQPHECDLIVGYCPTTDDLYFSVVTGAVEYRASADNRLVSLAQIFEVSEGMSATIP
jgi:hypothetical protein